MAHAPFTFTNIPFEKGKLTAIGYINGKEATRDERLTPKEAEYIEIFADTQGIDLSADGSDFIFVHALVKDKNGTVVTGNSQKIIFKAEGGAKFIGENPVRAQAGIASIILQAGISPDKIKLYAPGDGLISIERKNP